MIRLLFIVACVALQSCDGIPDIVRTERVLSEETDVLIPAGTPFTTPSGAVGVTTEPIEATVPAGTKIEGTDYRAAMFGVLIGAAICAVVLVVVMPKRIRT